MQHPSDSKLARLGFVEEFCELPEIAQLRATDSRLRAAGGRQNKNHRAINIFLLLAKNSGALRKFFVRHFYR